VPKCQEKWEAQQEKLPREERREIPSPPENFHKILSGEVTGKELIKINQKSSEDYKNEVLEPCTVCARTFLPEALLRHKNFCREERPMSKKKGPSYTSKMKSKVNYPKLKPSKTTGPSKPSHRQEGTESPGSLSQSPVLIRKETITISKSSDLNDVGTEDPHIKKQVAKTPVPSSSINRKDTVILSKGTADDTENTSEKKRQGKIGDGRVAVTEDQSKPENNNIPTKNEFIQLIETEAIFDSQKHRKAILEMVTGYARNVRRTQILELLDHEVLEDVDNLEDVITILTEYVRSKTNNNDH